MFKNDYQLFTSHESLSTQVPVGTDEGLKHDSGIHCDELVSLPKSILTNFIGILTEEKIRLLDKALKAALQLYDN